MALSSELSTRCDRSLQVPVLEVFTSIQGEGRYAGEPQTFLRLAGCPLRCRWCDTPGSWDLPRPDAEVRRGQGRKPQRAWCTPFQIATWIADIEEGSARTLSITGGEPLLWPDFLLELRPFLGARRIHLETAGAHPAALERVLEMMDHVSLDLKLPADLGPPVPLSVLPTDDSATSGALDLSPSAAAAVPSDEASWAEVRRTSLELVAGRDACAKIIVTGDREARAFLPLLDDIVRFAPELMVILQPVTPLAGVPAPDHDLLETLVELALDRSLTVRVLPQVHRILRWR